MIIANLFASLGLKIQKESFNKADELIGNLKKALVGFFAFKTAQWFAGLVNQTAELAGRLVESSQKTGIMIESLQELEHAANQSGVSAEGVSTALKILSRNMLAAKNGSKEAKETFKDLGVKIKDNNGDLRDAEQIFAEVADRFAEMDNGAEKAGLAMKVFGRSGVDLIPLLNEGKDGIEELRKEFRELGSSLTARDAIALEGWGDQVNVVKEIIKGLKTEIVLALFPTIKKVTERIVDWTKKNKEFVKVKIRQAVDLFTRALRALWEISLKVVDVGKVVVKWLVDFEQRVQILRPAIYYVVGLLTHMAAKAALVALKAAALANPFIAITTVLLAVGAAVAKAFGVEPIVFFTKVLDIAVKTFENAIKFVRQLIEGTAETVQSVGEALGVMEPKNAKKSAERKARPFGHLNDKNLQVFAGTPGSFGREAQKEVELRRQSSLGRDASRKVSRPGVSIGDTNVTVNATTNANPKEIAAEVRKEIRRHHESVTRDLAASTGD